MHSQKLLKNYINNNNVYMMYSIHPCPNIIYLAKVTLVNVLIRYYGD